MVFMAEGGFDIDNWPHLAAWAALSDPRLHPVEGAGSRCKDFPGNDGQSPAGVRLAFLCRPKTEMDGGVFRMRDDKPKPCVSAPAPDTRPLPI